MVILPCVTARHGMEISHMDTWWGEWGWHVLITDVMSSSNCNLKQRADNIHTNSCLWIRDRVILDLKPQVSSFAVSRLLC